MTYTEEQLEEFYQCYDLNGSASSNAFTSGYVETDCETNVPVCVLYNENNLAKIGLCVDLILKLGDYDTVEDELSRRNIKMDSSYGTIWIGMDHGSDGGIDYGWVAILQIDLQTGTGWTADEPLISVYAPCAPEDMDAFDEHKRACWNAMRRDLDNFRE